jgi:hypothetical protein
MMDIMFPACYAAASKSGREEHATEADADGLVTEVTVRALRQRQEEAARRCSRYRKKGPPLNLAYLSAMLLQLLPDLVQSVLSGRSPDGAATCRKAVCMLA